VGDCKDANTADCTPQPLEAAAQASCGTCQRLQPGTCTGTTGGTCENYSAGTDTGACRECDGAGAEQMPADDLDCGVVDCGGWYALSGTAGPTSTEECHGHQDISTNRCEALGDCKDSNSADCAGQPTEAAAQASCGTCERMRAGTCDTTTAGVCDPYSAGTEADAGRELHGDHGRHL
jgi:hypothetical protein